MEAQRVRLGLLDPTLWGNGTVTALRVGVIVVAGWILRYVRQRDYHGNAHYMANGLITTVTKDGSAHELRIRQHGKVQS